MQQRTWGQSKHSLVEELMTGMGRTRILGHPMAEWAERAATTQRSAVWLAFTRRDTRELSSSFLDEAGEDDEEVEVQRGANRLGAR